MPKIILYSYLLILKSYLNGRVFRVRIGEDISENYSINAGVPQGSVLGPLLHVLFAADFPTNNETTTVTFADDTVTMAVNKKPVTFSYFYFSKVKLLLL